MDVEAVAGAGLETPAPASSRRIGWRKIAVVLATALVVGYAATGLFVTTLYLPLTEGSSVGSDQETPGSLFVTSISSPMESGSLWTWCFTPGANFAWFASLRNTGPLPVTIFGAGLPAHPDGFDQVDFAQARVATPADTPTYTHAMISNAATAPVLQPTTLAPGDELEVWARFKMGDGPEGQGVTVWKQSLSVHYSVLGFERTADVPFRDGVGIDGAPCPSPSWP